MTMKKHDEFVNFVIEQMQALGNVYAKAMFGGYGINIDDQMFALIADDTLYLKTNAGNLADFEQRGLLPFTYSRDGKAYRMSYSEAPAELFDDDDVMKLWASKAIEAALESRKHRKGSRRSS